MSREDQYNVTVSIDELTLGTFDKLTGGMIDSSETKYKPGGMAPEISLGGSKTVENVTVTRLYKFDRDHPLIGTLVSKVGKGNTTITKQPLDVDGNVFGAPMIYRGVLKSVTPPDHDSMGSDPGLLALEVSPSAGVS